MKSYFTDREGGPKPRTVNAIDGRVWGGLCALITARLNDESFGFRFPISCPDGNAPCGCDRQVLDLTIAAEIKQIEWPLNPQVVPSTGAIMDLLEFVAESVGAPVQGTWHSYLAHYHLAWDREAGLQRFVSEVNRLFARNEVAFELSENGTAHRLLPGPLQEALAGALFQTGDDETDRLLEAARRLILAPELSQRRDALEKM